MWPFVTARWNFGSSGGEREVEGDDLAWCEILISRPYFEAEFGGQAWKGVECLTILGSHDQLAVEKE